MRSTDIVQKFRHGRYPEMSLDLLIPVAMDIRRQLDTQKTQQSQGTKKRKVAGPGAKTAKKKQKTS